MVVTDTRKDENNIWQFVQVKAFKLESDEPSANDADATVEESPRKQVEVREPIRPSTAPASPTSPVVSQSSALKKQQERREMMKLKLQQMKETSFKSQYCDSGASTSRPFTTARSVRSTTAITTRYIPSPPRTTRDAMMTSRAQTTRTQGPRTSRTVTAPRRTPTPEKIRE